MEKNETIYLTVNVSNGQDEHIGTMIFLPEHRHRFEEKLVLMCDEHFGAQVVVPPNLKIEDYVDGNSGTIEIKVDDGIQDEEYPNEISICQTWLY